MKHAEGLEWAVHAMTLLAPLPPDRALPAHALASYFDLPEAYMAKQMQKLSAAGLVETRRGPKGGYALARPAAAITLLEITEAVDGREKHFRCTEIRRCGPTGVGPEHYPRPCSIARSFWKAEAAWRRELAGVTLADLIGIGMAEMPPAQAEKAVKWFRDTLSED